MRHLSINEGAGFTGPDSVHSDFGTHKSFTYLLTFTDWLTSCLPAVQLQSRNKTHSVSYLVVIDKVEEM